MRRWRGARSYLWGFVDQSASSATNFGLVLAAGRVLGPAGLGVVFVGFSAYLVALGFQRALINDPLVATTAAESPERRRASTECALTVTLVAAGAGGAALAAAGLAVSGSIGRGLLVVAPWLTATLVQDLWRAALFRDGRAPAAAANDGMWLVVMAGVAPLVLLSRDVWVVVSCWGAGAAAGALLGFVQTGLRPAGLRRGARWWRAEAWPFGRWLGLNSVLYSLGSTVTVLLLAAFIGAASLGGLRAVESVFAPLSLIVPALALPGLPAVSRALRVSPRAARVLALRLGAVATSVTALYVVVLAAGRDSVVPLVFGSSFHGFSKLVWPVGGGQILSSVALAFGLVLKAERRGRALFVSGSVGSVATLGLAVGLAKTNGVAGAAWGIAAGSGIAALTMAALALSAHARRPAAAAAKDSVKRACAGVAGAGRSLWPRARVVVLCYHSVGSKLPADVFERQVEWLAENSDVVDLEDVPRLARSTRGNRPVVAVTFDDGYADNYEIALPVLARHRVGATFFITTGLVNRVPAVLDEFRRLRDTDEIRTLDWGQIRELRAAGFGVGAHTYSHPNLLRLRGGDLEREIALPRLVLEEQLGEPVTAIAYPFGKPRRHVSDEVTAVVRACGYRLAVTTVCRGVRPGDDALTIPRILVGADPVETFSRKILGWWDFVGGWQERAPVPLARVVSRGDFQV